MASEVNIEEEKRTGAFVSKVLAHFYRRFIPVLKKKEARL